MSEGVLGGNVSHFVIGRKGGTAERCHPYKCVTFYYSAEILDRGKVSPFKCVRKCVIFYYSEERWHRGKVAPRKGSIIYMCVEM